MIRIAREEDLDNLNRMALEAIRKAAYAFISDQGRVVTVIKHFLQESTDKSIIFVDEEGHGMIAGMIVPFAYGIEDQAIELLWWVDEEYRLTGIGRELLEGFEVWAASRGARIVTMVSIDDHVGRYYEKQGYTLCERTYMKDLKPWQQ